MPLGNQSLFWGLSKSQCHLLCHHVPFLLSFENRAAPSQCSVGTSFKKYVTCSFHHPVLSEWWGKVCAGGSLSGWSGLGRVNTRRYSHHCGLSSKGTGLQLISSPVLSQLFSFNILCFFKMWGLVSSNVVTSYICLWFKKHVIQTRVEFSRFTGAQGWNIRATASSQTFPNSCFSGFPFLSNPLVRFLILFRVFFIGDSPQNLLGSCLLPAASILYSCVPEGEDDLHSLLIQSQLWASSPTLPPRPQYQLSCQI